MPTIGLLVPGLPSLCWEYIYPFVCQRGNPPQLHLEIFGLPAFLNFMTEGTELSEEEDYLSRVLVRSEMFIAITSRGSYDRCCMDLLKADALLTSHVRSPYQDS